MGPAKHKRSPAFGSTFMLVSALWLSGLQSIVGAKWKSKIKGRFSKPAGYAWVRRSGGEQVWVPVTQRPSDKDKWLAEHKEQISERYQALQVAAKLYFQLKGDLNPKEMTYIKDEYCHSIRGCVSLEKIMDFLAYKWIPPRFKVEEDIEQKFGKIKDGRFFKPAKELTYQTVLEDMGVYLRSRPLKAVPPPVRRLISNAYNYDFSDHNWPGDTIAREAYRPREPTPAMQTLMDALNITNSLSETDLETYHFPHPGCRMKCRVKAMHEANLPESWAYVDGKGPVQEELNPKAKHMLFEEEKEFMFASTFQRILGYLANVGMYMVGLSFAAVAGYFVVRKLYVPPPPVRLQHAP